MATSTRALAAWAAVVMAQAAWCAATAAPMRPVSESPPAAPREPAANAPADPVEALEKSLVFVPSPYPNGNWNPAGLAFEDAWFQSADGTQLHGWYVPHDNPRAVILFCHGNAGNVTHRAGTLRALHDWVGASVLVFDYRGYGKSKGTPSEQGVLADARAARAWLARRAGIDEKQIVLLGRSLGGGVAVDLAAADGARALILESTFTSLPDVAKASYPLLPARLLMRTRLDSASKIGNYRGPLLQSHGDADKLVPYKLGRRLHDAANEPKKFLTFLRAGHNDPPPREYYDILGDFLDEANKKS
jgi:hypothetical protein